jgi:hypothetical protein|tara:strand:- start:185 stop:370 length:186 start_codon:yes stop_codon:yes gene_type:complete
MKVYTLTIVYDENKEEVEYITEELQGDGSEVLTEHEVMKFDDSDDKDDLRFITGCYIIGEA